MAPYRKRPLIIDAAQFSMEAYYATGTIPPGACVCGAHFGVHCHTLEGLLNVQDGDWLVTGVMGEPYLVRDDNFRRTYEPVAPEESTP